jgi:hypothetical protein
VETSWRANIAKIKLKDNIKMDLTGISFEDVSCKELAQD